MRNLLKKDPDIKRVVASADASIMVIINLSMTVKVDTVDAFQGQEADIVIVSLVRTHSAGFTDS